ncbi:hypothetical protein A4H97_06295 [Niastella yeongjuensis]|uniref:Uncharacterized protein n=1 Tax=Niastella yeongjuensis TaxID=354355 RepID=A0A1V9ELV9_9BACT|nr:hypothetical protein A4H97_06295 [Niastella yeongjuensis]
MPTNWVVRCNIRIYRISAPIPPMKNKSAWFSINLPIFRLWWLRWLWRGRDFTIKVVNHKILTRLIKNQAFIVIIPKSIFLQP